MQVACHGISMQKSAKAGIKKLRETDVSVMLKEFKQLNEGLVPENPLVVHTDEITYSTEERKKLYQQ